MNNKQRIPRHEDRRPGHVASFIAALCVATGKDHFAEQAFGVLVSHASTRRFENQPSN